ncbi:MAG TPA: cyclomaltodextrinase C-terminal domain-containing protein, partial [Phaeodactylibacter sp.]|nr:cyclomaltodextrinase C-terminal domain-containing protein [Phaeodactylibacter sp.]
LNWRKGNETVHHGKLMQFVPHEGVYTIFRYTDEGKVMTILNKNAEAKTIALDRYAEMLSGTSRGEDVISGKAYQTSGEVELPGKSALILEIE